MDRLSPGAVLGRSFSLWGRHFRVFTLVAVAIQLPTILLAAATPGGDGSRLVGLLSSVLGFVVTGALTSGALRAVRGEAPRFGEMARAGLRRAWAVLGASILSGLAILLGTLLLIVPGVILACACAVAVPVAVAEPGLGSSDALSRSFQLTKGSRVGVLLVGVVLLVFVVAVGGATAALDLGGEAAGLPAALVAAAEQLIVEAAAAIVAIASAIAYHDLRALKEGVDTAQVASVFE